MGLHCVESRGSALHCDWPEGCARSVLQETEDLDEEDVSEGDVMKFHHIKTAYSACCDFYPENKNLSMGQFTQAMCERKVAEKSDPILIARYVVENRWNNHRRPYYCVFPAIADALCKVNLDVPLKHVRLPMAEIAILFSEPIADGDRRIAAMLASHTEHDDLIVWMHDGAIHAEGMPVVRSACFSLHDKEAIVQDCVKRFGDEFQASAGKCMQILIGLTLLVDDPEIVCADVLTADRDKYNKTRDDKFINKAHRRGKVGWLVGEKMEYAPHLRKPHFAIRWMGRGGKFPRLRPIKGSIVNRKKIAEVPTGYEGKVE